MTNTNYPAALKKFQNDVKSAVNFHNPNFTNSAIIRERAKRLSQARAELAAQIPKKQTETTRGARVDVLDALRQRMDQGAAASRGFGPSPLVCAHVGIDRWGLPGRVGGHAKLSRVPAPDGTCRTATPFGGAMRAAAATGPNRLTG